MPKVNLLPPDVIAKIAAGEVVDRPSSVVKELLENSIDAGATSVEIHLKDAGKELIHLKDNGSGIAREDLETIFQRHATSKITSIDDLDALASMGFRGEALYSIAAVSDVRVKTKTTIETVVPAKAGILTLDPRLKHSGMTHQTDLDSRQELSPSSRGLPKVAGMTNATAWEMHLRGGVRQGLQPAAASHAGTDIKVAELFFNTPARRKFLKNNTSEIAQIVRSVLPYALIYPQLRILLSNNGRDLLDIRPSTDRLDHVADVLNVDAKDLLACEQDFPDENINVRLTLGNINIQRPRRDLQFIFVNNRPVESKNLSFNLNDIYKLILPPGVYGCFIAEIHLSPANVDVNIHPTKREVRLHGEARINSMLRRMAEYQLMQHGGMKTITPSGSWTPPGQMQGVLNSSPLAGEVRWGGDITLSSTPLPNPPHRGEGSNANANLFAASEHLFQSDNSLNTRFARARYIGQWMNKFLLFEEGSSLLLVDQHAAQERIMFEKFSNQIEHGKIEIQPLLTPLLIKLSPIEKIAYDDIKKELEELGIETTQFDSDTVAIQTQPVLLKNITNALRSLLAGDGIARCDKATLARRACKASIVTGDPLAPTQVEHQRRELLACQHPFTCPHGRPTVIELTEGFIDRQFLRS